MFACPKDIKQSIIAYTALTICLDGIKSGDYKLPLELDYSSVKGWESSCDVSLINEMVNNGMYNYDSILNNVVINYSLTMGMGYNDEQKHKFIKNRCNFVIKCVLSKR